MFLCVCWGGSVCVCVCVCVRVCVPVSVSTVHMYCLCCGESVVVSLGEQGCGGKGGHGETSSHVVCVSRGYGGG